MTITEDERKSLEAIKKHLKAYCKDKKNITLIRFNFNQTQQMENQTFDAYLTELRHKVRHCEYAQLEDSLLVDRIIAGIRNDDVRQKLLQTEDLTLQRCVELCRLSEVDMGLLRIGSQKEVSVIKKKSKVAHGDATHRRKQQRPPCKYCGTEHQQKKMPSIW